MQIEGTRILQSAPHFTLERHRLYSKTSFQTKTKFKDILY